MSEATAVIESGKPSHVMRTLLMVFPAGLVVTSIIAVFLYFQFQEQAQTRSIRYAAGLRVELSAESLAKHQRVLQQTQRDAGSALLAASSYASSTLGAENMGYQTRLLRADTAPTTPLAALDVELTGQQRARDVVLVLCDYTSPDAVSLLLGIAHDITGEAPRRTLRLAFLRDTAALPAYYKDCVSPQERLSHLILLGSMAGLQDAELRSTMHLPEAATLIQRPAVADAVQPALQKALQLKKQLMELAERL
jgi:hypothetical protein